MILHLKNIETHRLIIRPFYEDDLEMAYQIRSDPDVGRFIGSEISREDSDKRIREFIRLTRSSGLGARAVLYKPNNELIGWCGLQYFLNTEEIELFYGVAKHMWGCGIAVEAASVFLKAGFQQIGCRRIIASVHPDNHSSQRVLEKMAFHQYGTHYHPYKQIECLLYEAFQR